MADMRGLVGIDAGVLDKAKSGASDVGVLVGGYAAGYGGAVEADVEVACSGYFYAGNAFGELGGELSGQFGGNSPGGFRRRLASSKATGRASSPRAMLGGCSTTRFVSVVSYLDCRMAWMRAKRDC